MSSFKITADQVGKRLDQTILTILPELSRGWVQKLIADGLVKIDGEAASKSSQKLKLGQAVEVDYNPTEAAAIPDIKLPILYEDADCVVINKPVGILSHGKANSRYAPEATVATWLRNRTNELGDGERAGIVHRLDRATSGVMVCAKNETALSWFQKQFSQRKVQKQYLAIVSGHVRPDAAIIDMPIQRNPKAPATFRVGAGGKPSQTRYETARSNESYTMLRLYPLTGRTHQLRVHLKHQNHPIVGDIIYDGEAADRLYLHAETLEITLPTSLERKVFKAPVPPEFDKLMEQKTQ